MVDSKFDALLHEIDQFNNNTSLQNTENYLKIVNNPLYNELKKASIKGCHFTNSSLKTFLDIVAVKISSQVIDSTITKLKSRLNNG